MLGGYGGTNAMETEMQINHEEINKACASKPLTRKISIHCQWLLQLLSESRECELPQQSPGVYTKRTSDIQ